MAQDGAFIKTDCSVTIFGTHQLLIVDAWRETVASSPVGEIKRTQGGLDMTA